MEHYQKRVIEEKGQLDLKIKKLSEFLDSDLKMFKDLKDIEKRDLQRQLSSMEDYASILNRRITRF